LTTGESVAHLIRAPMPFISTTPQGLARAAADLHRAHAAAAVQELDIFVGSTCGKKDIGTVRVWQDAWELFIPSL
jgi:hypothetical protein